MAKRPNIVFVFADQLRYDALACNGNRHVVTPNIDRLGREGVIFDNAFSSCPICSPYRGQLLSGCYSHVNGVMCNEYRLFDNQRTIAHMLGEAGYRTAYVGKWHLGYGPYPEHKRYGFDDLYSYNCIHSYYEVSYWHNEEGPFRMVDYAPKIETDLAIQYMREATEHDSERPFCLFMSWGPPHWNGLGKNRRYGDFPQSFDHYDPDALEIAENVPRQLRSFAQEELSDYYGMVSSLDDCFGRLMGELDSLGIADDTILCFSSDHGDHLSSHGFVTPGDAWMHHSMRASKATPFEESIHIPLLIRYPRATVGGRRSDSFFSSVDVLPTLLDLAEVRAADTVQGHSVAHAVRNETGEDRDSVYLQILGTGWPNRDQWVGLWRGVRTKRYLYARWKDRKGLRMLFDLQKDPGQLHNLVSEPAASEIVTEMENRLVSWIESTGDPFETGQRLPITEMLDLGQAFISARWHPSAPPEYVHAIEKNHLGFKTGEQPGDPFASP